MECPTVRIKATTGSYPFTTINLADFDPAKHVRYVEGAELPSIQADAEAHIANASVTDNVAADAAPAAKRGRK